MHCLICDDFFMEQVSWFSFFVKQHQSCICSHCEKRFSYVIGKVCEDCGRPLKDLLDIYKRGDVCYDCMRWREQNVLPYVKNRSLYVYNDWMEEVLARFKFRGDAVLASLFAADLRSAYQTYFLNFKVVPIPLSREREQDRGFNQAELLAECLQVPLMKSSFMRSETEKQSKKTRKQRLTSSCPFYFTLEEDFTDFNIVLVDDVYTTGITVRQAARCFYEKGAKSVSSLTLCRG
ncbi:competence protein ComF [Bacillus manliponensis]|uniref:Competence protein ComF n=1 Tax=Bacillus manliponensis TaxID=574376 RepID=A0A073KGC6_9BACI|nr:ComF family protein [Bacillus manliponensis]KEK21353.1 competence protein ComF [Bacillus manliponensis]